MILQAHYNGDNWHLLHRTDRSLLGSESTGNHTIAYYCKAVTTYF